MAIKLEEEGSGWDVQKEPSVVVLILGDYIFELNDEEAFDIGVALLNAGEN